MRKVYLNELAGMPTPDVWTDIKGLAFHSSEKLGYPTQKPLALLKRIITAASNPGDVVLDPFCGCGTAVLAAQALKREWIGIDITHLAISLIEKRLRDSSPGATFDVEGTPTDFAGARDLAQRDKYQFQWWACSLVNAQPYLGKKKGADGGIDGLIYFEDDKGPAKKIIVSVKGGDSVGISMIREMAATVAAERAHVGLFITLVEPTRQMENEANRAGFYDSPFGVSYPKLQILSVSDLLSGAVRPQYPFGGGGVSFIRAPLAMIDSSSAQSRLF